MTATVEKIPMLDLNMQYAPIRDEVLKAFEEVFDSKQFIQGPKVVALEAAISDYCGAKHAIGVSSGTDALLVAMMAMGIGPGDEVITTPFTFFATVGSIVRLGATPVFVDIDPDTLNIDAKQIDAKITEKTVAIMPVHLFGQMADMDPIMTLARDDNLLGIEDAAQAIGARYKSQDGKEYRAGTMGDVGCFSFFPSKNLGCCGDGGMVTTNDTKLYEKISSLRTHGATRKYYHDLVGGNFRLDPLQAAVLLVKLPHLDDQHEGRRKNADYYTKALSGQVKTPSVQDGNYMIFNQYTIQSPKRDALQAALTEAQIGNAIYYPVPLHLQNCFSNLGYKQGDMPVAEQASQSVLSIPIYPDLTQAQQDRIIKTIQSVS